MRQPIPLGVIILITIDVIFILAYFYLHFAFDGLTDDEPFFQTIEGIAGVVSITCSIYFMLRPSAFGWKFVLINTFLFAVFEGSQVLFFGDAEYLLFDIKVPWLSVLVNFVFGALISAIIFWYIYNKKDYFHGVPKIESSRGDVLDDESWQ